MKKKETPSVGNIFKEQEEKPTEKTKSLPYDVPLIPAIDIIRGPIHPERIATVDTPEDRIEPLLINADGHSYSIGCQPAFSAWNPTIQRTDGSDSIVRTLSRCIEHTGVD
ncbi:MAG: hypothetical protein WC067_01845 [Candidatus Methanomethylophilaceae archaeon]